MISIDFLDKVDVFKQLSDDQLRMIQDCAEIVEFRRTERIFAQGEDAVSVWIVVEGDVELRTEPAENQSSAAEPEVSFMSTAHAFGWTCFVPPYHYQLSGYCISRSCKVIRLGREDLLGLFDKDADLGFRVMSYLIEVVGTQFQQLQDEIAKKRGIEVMSRW